MRNYMLSILIVGLAGLCSAPLALAEEEQQRVAERPEGEREGDRGQFEHRLPPTRQLGMLERLESEVTKRLDLDEEQRKVVATLFEEHLTSVREKIEQQREQAKEQREAIRELVRELREARKAQDQERLAAIKEQLAARRSGGDEIAQMNKEFFEDVKAVLPEEQAEEFDKLVKRLMTRERPERTGFVRIRELRRAVGTLQLADEQREAIKKVFAGTSQQVQEVRDDPDKMKELEESLRQAIIDELDEEQEAAFTKKLAELDKPSELRPGRASTPKRSQRVHDAEHEGQDKEGDVEEQEVEEADEVEQVEAGEEKL